MNKFLLCVSLLLIISSCATWNRIKSNQVLVKASLESSQFYQEIDFELRSGFPIFEVNIEGHAYRFMFDTGGYTVLSEEVIQALRNFQKASYIDVKDGNSITQRIETYVLDQLQIGEVVFSEVGFAKIGFTESEWFQCLGVDGTLGPNILKECFWNFRKESGTLVFTDVPDRLPIFKEHHKIEITTDNVYKPTIAYSVGTYQSTLGFDTGFNGLLFLIDSPQRDFLKTSPHINKLGARMNAGHSTQSIQQRIVKLDAIDINGLVLDSVLATTSDIASSDLLGMDILEYYDIGIDLSNKALYFEKNKTTSLPHQLESFGLGFAYRNGQVEIGYVYENGPADQEGIRPGDVVTRINGVAVNVKDYCDFVEHFDFSKGEELQLEVNQGEKQTMVKLKKENLL